MQAEAEPQPDLGHAVPNLRGASQGTSRPVEHGEETVAGRVGFPALEALQRAMRAAGSTVDSLRAGLAWRLDDHAEARRLAEAGLAPDARVGSPGWVKRSTDLLARVREPLSVED